MCGYPKSIVGDERCKKGRTTAAERTTEGGEGRKVKKALKTNTELRYVFIVVALYYILLFLLTPSTLERILEPLDL